MKTQSGRSMIEMLGVLAIIGVLSIGGLAGYTKAMNSYQANQIMDYMNRCSVAVQEKLGYDGKITGTTNKCNDAGFLGTSDVLSGIQVNIPKIDADASSFDLTTKDAIDASVCAVIAGRATAGGVTWACPTDTKKVKATYSL